MTELATQDEARIPQLLDRAAAALLSARNSGEVLDARDMARVAFDAAKSAGRIAKAKKAHDDVMAAVYRAQAEALKIEARAKMRIADEYDAAQERGEVAGHGGDKVSNLGSHKVAPTAADIGLRYDQIHEARKLRDAEAAAPGATDRALDAIVARGDEPTRAALKRELNPAEQADAKARRDLSKLTREALEDDVIGLREALARAREVNAKLLNENRDLKERLKDFDGDQAEIIRGLHNQLKHKSSEMFRANEKAAAALREAHVLRKRVKELEESGIPV